MMFTDIVTYLLTNMFFTGLVLFPLAVFTVLRVMNSAMKMMMVMSGFIECNMIRHNNTIDTVMRSPKGRKIVYKGRKFQFSDEPSYILRKGPVPMTFYDLVTGLQLPLKSLDRELINNEITDTAVKTSYDLGYKDGLDRIKKDENLQILLLIGMLLLIMVSGFIAFKMSDMSKTLPTMQDGINAISEAIKGLKDAPAVVG